MALPPLPVDDVLPHLRATLDTHRLVVLEAPPGTGKTTRVPPALLEASWLDDRRVIVLEPRRVAARAAARRMAAERGEPVGRTVGFRTRDETNVGSATRIEVVTEGVLTRMVLDDPGLDGVGAVVFDEFHERSLPGDLGLALVRETSDALRPDLRLVVMSATFDAVGVAERLGADAVLRVDGVSHPVDTTYRPPAPGRRLLDETVDCIVDVLADSRHSGDVLVFLDGAGAIRRVSNGLAGRLGERIGKDLVVLPLHGNLPPGAQDDALSPDDRGRRKIVLSTPVAETSVTIDGVASVIDTGLRRRPELDRGRDMTRLRTVTASRAATDQRRGRAGRQRPGTCVRLWAERDDQTRPAEETPEILTADLTGLALDVAIWGATDPTELPWLDPPPPGPYGDARATLRSLEALDDEHRPTDIGRRMHRLGAEPRLAHLLVRAVDLEPTLPGAIATAAAVAALLSDRDPLRGTGGVDLRRRLDLLTGDDRRGVDRAADRGTARRARRLADRWRRALTADLAHRWPDTDPGPPDPDLTGLLVSLAHPGRVARRRGDGGGHLLVSGAGVVVEPDDPMSREPWLAVAETDGAAGDARVWLAAPLSLDDIETHHADRIDEVDHGGWDRRARDVVFERRTRLGAIVIHRRPEATPATEAVVAGLLEGVRREGLGLLGWTDADRRFRDRLAFVHSVRGDDWPAVDDDALLGRLEDWLAPALGRTSRRRDLETLSVRGALESLLDWRRLRELDRLAPTHLTVPSGSRLPIDYAAEGGPALDVRLQEVFGLERSPTVADGETTVVLRLLSPAHRPVQVTSDLASFWRDGYAEVRKELRGRYPKHHWPEDPMTAAPTARAKPRRR